MKINLQNILFKKKKIAVRYQGLAMIEAMLAITIIMIAIMAPLTISTYTSKYAKFALNRIVATYIADEQLEFMVNLRKSLDIYCFNVSTDCTNSNSFDEFYYTLNSGLGCGTVAAPCYVDESSFTYPPANPPAKPIFSPRVDLANCPNLFINNNDIASCAAQNADSEISPFTRKLIIENIDNLTNQDRLGNSGDTRPNGIKLTSLVCINDPNCIPGDDKAITLVYNIYR